MKKNNHIQFRNQLFFIGIDVHKRNWTVTIRTNHLTLKTFSMNPCPADLFSYLNTRYPGGKYYSVYEAGYSGFWIHQELCSLGFENIVINAADVPTTNKETHSKRDPIDSRKLAREPENHSLRGIFIPDTFHQQFRRLCRLKAQTIQSQTRTKNRIKALLSFYGISIPHHAQLSPWSNSFIKWLESLELTFPVGTSTLRLLIGELLGYRQQ